MAVPVPTNRAATICNPGQVSVTQSIKFLSTMRNKLLRVIVFYSTNSDLVFSVIPEFQIMI